jgi:hypothetical protein
MSTTSGHTEKIESLIAERDSLRAVNAELLGALESVKSNLMHHRRFGVDDMGSWKRAATGAEVDIEEAIGRAAIASARKQGEQG